MPGRIRNTKNLAKRIDRGYLKRLFPLPAWRRILTAALLIASLGWLGLYAISRDQGPYSSGPLTRAHNFLGEKCSSCHSAKGWLGKKVADAQCSACHDGPLHQAEQTFNPACVSCHVEHRGMPRLTAATDDGCVACHGNLKTKSGRLTVAASVESFTDGHPQFGAAAKNTIDPGNIRFNHEKHVGKDIGQKCGDCHNASKTLVALPKYADNCAACHPLNFDDKIADAAPHGQPAVVRQFVTAQLTKYIAAHPADLGQQSSAAWIKGRTEAAEKQLWGETCARCHDTKETDAAGLPMVRPAMLTARWFRKAVFEHGAHQELTCISCHPDAATSKSASDVMLPGIQVCRQCHNSDSNSAGANCSTCHVYHDRSKEKGVDGKFVISQVQN